MTVKYLSQRGVQTIENVNLVCNLSESEKMLIDSDNFSKSTEIKTNQLLSIKN